MSATPWVTDTATARPSVRRRTTKTRGAAEVVSREGVLKRAGRHAMVLAVVCGASYGFFALMGHSLHSSAFKARANAELRTDAARQDVLELGRQVSALVSTESLDRFASMHGFARPGTLVAMNNADTKDQ